MRLRWKRDKAQTGLASIGSCPRGYEYHDGETVYATVSPMGGDWSRPLVGWYWVAGWGSSVPRKNTCREPCETIDEAKKQATEYVKHHIAEMQKEGQNE